MFKPVIAAAALVMAIAAVPGAASAQGYGNNYASGPSRNYSTQYRPIYPPRPYVLSPGQVVQHLYRAGWRNVRALARHGVYYTARADGRRGTYALVINGYTGYVISQRLIVYRRY